MNNLLFLGNIGAGEIILIALIVILLFGAKKIPELMKGLGKGVRSFKEGINNIENDINNAISTIQREVFSQNLDPKTLTLSQIFTLAGLSSSRWVLQGNAITLGKNATPDTQNSCIALSLTNAILELKITQKADSTLCEKLFARHPNGGKQIPLNTSNAIF